MSVNLTAASSILAVRNEHERERALEEFKSQVQNFDNYWKNGGSFHVILSDGLKGFELMNIITGRGFIVSYGLDSGEFSVDFPTEGFTTNSRTFNDPGWDPEFTAANFARRYQEKMNGIITEKFNEVEHHFQSFAECQTNQRIFNFTIDRYPKDLAKKIDQMLQKSGYRFTSDSGSWFNWNSTVKNYSVSL